MALISTARESIKSTCICLLYFGSFFAKKQMPSGVILAKQQFTVISVLTKPFSSSLARVRLTFF